MKAELERLGSLAKCGEFVLRARNLRIAILSTWLVLVVGTVWALMRQERSFAAEVKRVASLVKQSGSVQVRQEKLARWQDVVDLQGVLDGSFIATGQGGTATVGFGPDRSVQLGEETQVQITALVTGSQGAAFMIALIRGSIIAAVESTCTGCPLLVVRAGNDTFNVNVGNRVGVLKPVGKKAEKFNAKGPWPGLGSVPTPLISATFLRRDDVQSTPKPGLVRRTER